MARSALQRGVARSADVIRVVQYLPREPPGGAGTAFQCWRKPSLRTGSPSADRTTAASTTRGTSRNSCRGSSERRRSSRFSRPRTRATTRHRLNRVPAPTVGATHGQQVSRQLLADLAEVRGERLERPGEVLLGFFAGPADAEHNTPSPRQGGGTSRPRCRPLGRRRGRLRRASPRRRRGPSSGSRGARAEPTRQAPRDTRRWSAAPRRSSAQPPRASGQYLPTPAVTGWSRSTRRLSPRPAGRRGPGSSRRPQIEPSTGAAPKQWWRGYGPSGADLRGVRSGTRRV